MQVNTLTLKLGVRFEKAAVVDGNIVLTGYAGAMPCDSVVTPKEALQVMRLVIRPSILGLMVRSIFRREKKEKS